MSRFLPLLLFALLSACSKQQQVDLIVHHAHVYTVDSTFRMAEAFAIKDGKFIAIGKNDSILQHYQATKTIDAQGKYIYPGFIDPHCHFYAYGKGINEVNLFGTKSFEEVVERVVQFRKDNPEKAWILGMGWDQNDWKRKEFPNNKQLDSLFPNIPIVLRRVDGHALLANQKALDLAKIYPQMLIEGGQILLENGIENGKLTGVLIDNAMDFVTKVIPEPTAEQKKEFLFDAQKNCFSVGLTSIGEAGLDKNVIDLIDKCQKEKTLLMRIYAMISANKENLSYYLSKGFYKTDRLNVRSVKVYGDGALGSRGACLLHPYQDDAYSWGTLLQNPSQLDSLIAAISAKGFQINTHCIGDSANRVMLKIYAKHLKDNKQRWRIEHAQVVAANDRNYFGKYGIIPSVQPTHATSDMYWAGDRLGTERLKTAYSYQDLWQKAGIVALGSDFPIEDINPLYGFYAAVARQDDKGFPEGGFLIENALTREQALKGMTIWAAYAQFEEKEKGSIEVGKFADFVCLAEDLMTIEIRKTRDAKVLQTFIGGNCVFGMD